MEAFAEAINEERFDGDTVTAVHALGRLLDRFPAMVSTMAELDHLLLVSQVAIDLAHASRVVGNLNALSHAGLKDELLRSKDDLAGEFTRMAKDTGETLMKMR